jgi:hypothetical protein
MNSNDNRYLKEAFGDDKKKKWLKDNPTLTPNQIDSYIKRFDVIRKSRPAAAKTIDTNSVPKGDDRFDISKYNTWRSFEIFVDAVGAQTQLKGEKLSDKLEIDAKPLFEKNGLEVYYADNPQACIKYKGSIPYSWCVARPDSGNMFYNYRLQGDNPAFYFVKDVEATQKELSSIEKFTGKFNDEWHFFVIQVLNTANINNLTDENYVVTSANNDGDIHMNWNEIVKIQPKLNGLQSEFLPKPLSDDELVVIDKYKNGLTTQEFVKLTYNEKERFLDVYPTLDKPIKYDIFNALPYDLKNKYIGMNIGLSDAQYNSIQSEKNLLKRYAQMAEKKFEMWLKKSNDDDDGDFLTQDFQLKDSEIDVLHKYGILDVSKLTDDKVKDMIRHSRDNQKTVDVLLNANVPLTYSNVDNLLSYSHDKQPTIDTLLSKNIDLTDKNVSSLIWDDCTNQQKQRFNALKMKQLSALKLNQQLSETKFKYRDFYSYLK